MRKPRKHGKPKPLPNESVKLKLTSEPQKKVEPAVVVAAAVAVGAAPLAGQRIVGQSENEAIITGRNLKVGKAIRTGDITADPEVQRETDESTTGREVQEEAKGIMMGTRECREERVPWRLIGMCLQAALEI